MSTPRELKLKAADGLEIYADLSVPSGDGPHPLVVVIRGAAGGSRNERGELAFLAEHDALVPAGYAVATICHRGTPGHGEQFGNMHDLGGSHVGDVIAATTELSKLAEINANDISVLGASRGAFMAALAIAQCPLFRSAVLINGYYDLRAWCEFQEASFGDESPLVTVIRNSWTEFWNDFPVDERSPDRYIDAIRCPVMLVHGEDDVHVPPEQSRVFAKALAERGIATFLKMVPGLAHDYPEEDPAFWVPVWNSVVDFLSQSRAGSHSQ